MKRIVIVQFYKFFFLIFFYIPRKFINSFWVRFDVCMRLTAGRHTYERDPLWWTGICCNSNKKNSLSSLLLSLVFYYPISCKCVTPLIFVLQRHFVPTPLQFFNALIKLHRKNVDVGSISIVIRHHTFDCVLSNNTTISVFSFQLVEWIGHYRGSYIG